MDRRIWRKHFCTALAGACILLMLASCQKKEAAVPNEIPVTEAAAAEGSTHPEETEVTTPAEETEETVQPEENDPDPAVSSESLPAAVVPEDGSYQAYFHTDSSMFHVNEALDGKGKLTVRDGEMTIHVSLVSKTIVNLYPGTAEDAQKEGALLLEPTVDSVTYSDGFTEEVYGFDIPVPFLDREFDLALIGKKGVWYDHKVSVSDPVRIEEKEQAESSDTTAADPAAGRRLTVDLHGGSGKASIESAELVGEAEGQLLVRITWSSSKYDYMLLDGERYLPVNSGGHSTFEIPVPGIPCDLTVQADTVAMSQPHLIDYTIHFDEAEQ